LLSNRQAHRPTEAAKKNKDRPWVEKIAIKYNKTKQNSKGKQILKQKRMQENLVFDSSHTQLDGKLQL
jgi:hypothetical protein